MLKLVIVDDEKIIRETISNLIDWKSIGIEVIGVCKNGIDAYDFILDEYPDIVMTDIKMPGLSGIELIQRISEACEGIQFVILSGHGEFSLAAQAMQYGVKHYLLKPCNEQQIIETMQKVREEHYQNAAFLQKQRDIANTALNQKFMQSLIAEAIACDEDINDIIKPYVPLMDFNNTQYELCYVHYVEEINLQSCVQKIRDYQAKNMPEANFNFIYVKYTLMVFFSGNEACCNELDSFLATLRFAGQAVEPECKRISYFNLKQLTEEIIIKLKQYEMIYFITSAGTMPICNYNCVLGKLKKIEDKLNTCCENQPCCEDEPAEIFEELKELIYSVQDIDLLKTLITNLILRIMPKLPATEATDTTEFMMKMNQSESLKEIQDSFFANIDTLLPIRGSSSVKYKSFIEKTLAYINDNIEDPNLSLKWIAEHYLFMNVDYVSKQFVKQTGKKFSVYLNEARMQKAKKLLIEYETEKIYMVAEQIGCGNNPQYFSQVFKKYIGMTPTAYVKSLSIN